MSSFFSAAIDRLLLQSIQRATASVSQLASFISPPPAEGRIQTKNPRFTDSKKKKEKTVQETGRAG
jgi:hypothetical protein